MANVARLSVEVETAQVKKADGDLDRLTSSAKRTDAAVKGLGTSSKSSAAGVQSVSTATANLAPKMSNAAHQTKMAAMQLSQVGQQTMATGNFVQALAIQLPDLGLAFGTVGIAAGLAGGALLPLIANLLSAKEAVEELDAMSLDAVRSGIASLAELEARYDEAIQARAITQSAASDEAINAIGRELEAKRALFELEKITLEQRQRQLEASIAQREEEIRAAVEAATAIADVTDDSEGFARSRSASNILDITNQTLEANREGLLELKKQNAELTLVELSIHNISTALNDAGNAMDEINATTGEVNLKVEDQLDALKDAYIQYGNSRAEAERLALVDMAGGVLSAADAARVLAGELGIAHSIALGIANMSAASRAGVSGPDGAVQQIRGEHGTIDNAPGRTVNGLYGVISQTRIRARTASAASGGGGGGGSAGGGSSEAQQRQNDMTREAERIFESTRNAVERYNAELADLRELNQMGYLDDDTMARAVAELDAELRDAKFGDAIADLENLSNEFGNVFRNADELFGTKDEWDGFWKDAEDVAINALRNIAAEMASAGFESIFSAAAGLAPGQSGGGILGWASGLIPSFDGGGFTGNGSRSGGIDGKGGFLAINHPNETVIDHTKGGSGGATYNVSVDARGATSPQEVEAAVMRGMNAVRSEMPGIVSQYTKEVG